MKIGVDLDEVLVDFIGSLSSFYNLCYGTNFSKKDYQDYGLWKTWGCTQEEANDFIDVFLHSNHFFSMSLLPGVKEVLTKLSAKHELHIITARPEHHHAKTKDSVRRYFNGLIKEIHFSGNAFNIKYKGQSKAEICITNEIGVMVEDSLEYAEDCADKNIRVFLLNAPWNLNRKISEKITRLKSLENIFSFLE